MMIRPWLMSLMFLAVVPAALLGAEAAAPKATVADTAAKASAIRHFESLVRPLLAAKCFQCHDDKKQKGDLRLDSRAALLLGGASGPAVVPGDESKSLFIKAISYEDKDLQMPPKGKLSDEEIAILTQWVKSGAVWPGEKAIGGAKVRSKMARITDEDRQYWFFQPLSKPAVPAVKQKDRVTNPVDAFILARLEAKGLSLAAPSSKVTLIRRATFDLHGLPPSPEEIESFIADTSADAYEKLIDRLLASPRYGERMARRWLDIVRYADSDGFRADEYRPHLWRYRDWVVDAFNSDMPYDQFVTAQLAGDQASPGDADSLVATGYLRLWPYEYNQRDVHKQWNEILDDVTANAGEVFLGLSMYCARCHNHKFDPILQEDYFKLRAFFEPILPDDTLTIASAKDRAAYDKKMTEWEEKTRDIREKIEAIEGPARASATRSAVAKFGDEIKVHLLAPVNELAPADRQIRDLAYRQVEHELKNIAGRIKGEKKTELDQLEVELKKFDHLKPAPLTPVTAIRDVSATPPPTMIPGDRRERLIEPGYLTVLFKDDEKDNGKPAADAAASERDAHFVAATKGNDSISKAASQTTGRRLELAHWINRTDNALTTRVIVNRIWQQHFGVGIVATANDFGRQGELPTHPELLDWLSGEFLTGGRTLKKLHRVIMLSQAYQQSSLAADNSIDPGNTLLWKQRSRRLEAEQIRDGMLMVSGELDLIMHGTGSSDGQDRRSIYLKFMRNNRPELIELFDGPDGFNSTSQRNVTTIAPQSLMLINGEWTLQRARKLAESARRTGGDNQSKMIADAYLRTFGRSPSASEISDVSAFITSRSKPMVAKPVDQPKEPQETIDKPKQGIVFEFGKGQLLQLADNPALKFEEFTIEAVILLKSNDNSASVRTIISQWDGATTNAGWSLGVTGKKSKHLPQSLILQLVGKNEDGQPAYDVVASGIKVEFNTLYHLSVSVKVGQADSNGIAFHLRPLLEGAAVQTAQVNHTVIKEIDNNLALTLGGRDGKSAGPHGWDGILANVRLYKEGLAPQQLLGGRSPKNDALIADWRFAADVIEKDVSGAGHHLTSRKLTGAAASISSEGSSDKSDPSFDAFVDFCHVLLNANEFLYVD